MPDDIRPKNKMGHAPMLPLIFSMSLPAMFSMLVQALYNVVDSYYVSQFDPKALSAVSLAFPIQNLQIAFAVGTSVGVTSLISRRLGQGRREEAGRAAVHGILLALATWLVFALYGGFFAGPFFSLFESDPQIVEMGSTYISICLVFSFGSFVAVMLEKTLQATGNMILPMLCQLIGAVTNILLDPVFIFGMFGFPAMGVAGAAVATVAGQILTMFVCIAIMAFGRHEIDVTFKGFRFEPATVRDIYSVGLPSIVMQAIGTVMTIAMNAILSGFSTAAYTVFGLYFKLQSFVFMPVFGLTQGLLPIMGFNYGARNKKRLLDALKDGCIIALCIMTVGLLIFQVFPDRLIGIFNPTPELLEIGVPALRTICLCFLTAALGIVSGTLFQAVDKGVYSLVVSVMRQLAVLIPAAWLLARITGQVSAVWWSFPISEAVSLTVSVLFFLRLYKNEIRGLDAPEG